jgi:hypothetical protein
MAIPKEYLDSDFDFGFSTACTSIVSELSPICGVSELSAI